MPGSNEGALSAGAALVPFQEGRRTMPEFEGHVRRQVAVDSGAAASVIPERGLNGHRALPSGGSKKGIRYLA
eukprot:5990824-Alexandrium_andersonii.AAC.1